MTALSEDTTPERLALLHEWLRDLFGADDYRLAPASADASQRRYYRVAAGAETFIAMDAPPGREDIGAFMRITARLAARVNVPVIHHSDPARGFLLLSDLGDQTYLQSLNAATAGRLYQDAIDALVRMQAGVSGAGLAVYDAARLRAELALFNDWLVQRQLGITLDAGEARALENTQALLIQNALEQPRVFVHRDYHSRNLMLTPTANPGVLDYQDAVAGPLTYDLVSLLKDCYIKWPAPDIDRWLGYYLAELQRRRPAWAADRDQFRRWFDLMGAQRHLKASGIFARLARRDGKFGFLADIPRTLSYILDLQAAYPELRPLCEIIKRRVLPNLAARRPACGP